MGRRPWRDYVGERKGSRIVLKELAQRGTTRVLLVRCDCGAEDAISAGAWWKSTGKCPSCVNRVGGAEKLRRAIRCGRGVSLNARDVQDIALVLSHFDDTKSQGG